MTAEPMSVPLSRRQQSFLDEMGIGPVWTLRHAGGSVPEADFAQHSAATAAVPTIPTIPTIPANAAIPAAATIPASPAIQPQTSQPRTDMPGMERQRLNQPETQPQRPGNVAQQQRSTPAMNQVPAPGAVGLRNDVPSTFPTADSAWPDDLAVPDFVPASRTAKPNPSTNMPEAGQTAGMDWRQLQTAVANCRACGLCRNRSQTVFGVGDHDAKWLFVGEGPGYNEDIQGEPFVGPAGKLLDNMLLAIDLRRGENVYIANVVKCRPLDANGRDRPPSADEVAACRPFLERQIALLKPSVMVALGKTAATTLLDCAPDTALATLRGKLRHYGPQDVPLVVTYHPAYLLRKLSEKGKAWVDLCMARTAYNDHG